VPVEFPPAKSSGSNVNDNIKHHWITNLCEVRVRGIYNIRCKFTRNIYLLSLPSGTLLMTWTRKPSVDEAVATSSGTS